jgi:hypothetical protein
VLGASLLLKGEFDMRSLTSRLAVALLTFIMGVTAASIWLFRRHRELNQEPSTSLTSSNSSKVADFTHEADSLKGILSDFIFVGNDVYVPHSIASHDMEAKPLPTKFDVGRQYIFHSHYSDNDYHFEELQNRIRSKGFDILSAEVILLRNVGGAMFRIKFRNANHRFIIFNEPDRQILGNVEWYKSWSVDDYILVIEGNG